MRRERSREWQKILLVDDSKSLRMATERARLRGGLRADHSRGWYADNRVGANGAAGFDSAGHAPAKGDWIGRKEVLKKDPPTKAITVVAFTGLAQRNLERLKTDGAVAFLNKADLGLDRGSEGLLAALAGILRDVGKKVPVVATS